MKSVYILFIYNIFICSALLVDGQDNAMHFTRPPLQISDLAASQSQSVVTVGNNILQTDSIIESDSSVSVQTGRDSLPWSRIDLASPKMKKKKKPKSFPWWIPATAGGAGLITAGIIILTKEDEPIDPSVLLARNDQFSVPCKMNTVISVLSNDTGEGIRITAVSGAPAGWVSFDEQLITIQEPALQNFTFNYTITDNKGESSQATVTIVIEYPGIQIPNPTFQGNPGDIISHQIFANALCTECSVTNASSVPAANFNWTTNGNFNYQLPAVTQAQTIIFIFMVTDCCLQTGTASITVTIRPECGINPTFSVTHEKCDFADGSITTQIPQLNNYNFQWSNGRNTASISGLAQGTYQLTISEIANPECTDVFSVTVTSISPEITLQDDRYQAIANQLLTGNVLTNDSGQGLQVTGFQSLNVTEFAILADGSFRFLADQNAAAQYTSIYTVTDECGQTSTAKVVFDVARVPCDFMASISTFPADCGRNNGSASVVLSPVGAFYEILWPNAMTGPVAAGFGAGTYSLQVIKTDINCTLNFNFTIAEKPAPVYIQSFQTTPATCLGGATVNIQIASPTGSLMNLVVTREGLPFVTITAASGNVRLGEIINFLPGRYQITVNDQGSAGRCAQVLEFTITEEELPLTLQDDMAEILSNTVWSGNVLGNDTGAGMRVIDYTQPGPGLVNIEPNGNATYTPPPDFIGNATFIYTVRDTCGQEKSAVVTINVLPVPCEFTVEFNNQAADCGMQNGASEISILPQGSVFTVDWPDGTQGLNNLMLMGGNHTITVSEAGTGCIQEFTTFISELPPPELIQAITVNPATCEGPGSVNFVLANTSPENLVIEIYLDNQFTFSIIVEAQSTFSGAIGTLSAGSYLLQALISGIPRRCADSETIIIDSVELQMDLMDDTYTIPFASVWVGNVLLNDLGTGLAVSGVTPTGAGTVQILSNGNGTFFPNPGFSGTATFQYSAHDVCNQEQTATVTITVLPLLGGGFDSQSAGSLDTGNADEFKWPVKRTDPSVGDRHRSFLSVFKQSNSLMNWPLSPQIPEGTGIINEVPASFFQNGLKFNHLRGNWILQTGILFAESSLSNSGVSQLYQHVFQSSAGLAWLKHFNYNSVSMGSGIASAFVKSISSAGNARSSRLDHQSAVYLNSELSISVNPAYSFFMRPELFFFPDSRQWTGSISSGFTFNFE